ncbi:MAG: hypothetical protein J6M03_07015 [Clostridia bacterium]|nr:hypothetical protein [Clostridia bacterium]
MNKRKFNEITKRVLLLVLCMTLALGVLSSCNTSVDDTAEDGAENNSEYVQVLRVVDDIKYGGKFTNDKIETVTVRADAAPEGSIGDITELRGKFAASQICVGDYITTAKVLDKKPADAVDEEEDDIDKELSFEELGYVVVCDEARKDTDETYSQLINRFIAENPGRTIYIPDGNYMLSEPIVIPADPEKSVSLRLANQAVLRADPKWPDRNLAMIRVGVTEQEEGAEPLTMEEVEMMNYRSIHIIGGCIYGSGYASGISVEGSKDTYIYNVSIKSAVVGIHIKKGPNELGATWANVDNVNVTGSDTKDSVGVLVEGSYNTIANMRIASIMYGTQATETGERNIFRNLHPLIPPSLGNDSIGFYDMSDGNNYDICYNDQGATGFVMHEHTRSVYNGGFSYWWSKDQGYHVGFRSIGKFNSLIVSTKVSQHHDVQTDAYLLVEEDGGQGVVLYPIHQNKTNTYRYVLEQYCKTPIL